MLEVAVVWLIVIVGVFGQQVGFTLSSRSRNRNNRVYIWLSGIAAQIMYFACMRYVLVEHELSWDILIP